MNRVFGWALMKTHIKYCKLRHNNSSDSRIEGINSMLEDMCTYVTRVVLNKDYVQLYLPLDDAIRNKGKLTLISPPYITHISQLLNIARDKFNENNQLCNIMLPMEANIISTMKKEMNLISMTQL